jgi:hypothetical protein
MHADLCRTDDRLSAYLDGLNTHLRDKRQRASFAMYALGLLSDGEGKSMEPIAARASGSPEHTHVFTRGSFIFSVHLAGRTRQCDASGNSGSVVLGKPFITAVPELHAQLIQRRRARTLLQR